MNDRNRIEPLDTTLPDTINRHAVTAHQERVVMMRPPNTSMSPDEAIALAAWLVVGAELADFRVDALDRFLATLEAVRNT